MSLAFPFSIINIPYSRKEFKKKIRACATGKNPGKNPGVRHTYILMVTFHGAGDSAKSSANFYWRTFCRPFAEPLRLCTV